MTHPFCRKLCATAVIQEVDGWKTTSFLLVWLVWQVLPVSFTEGCPFSELPRIVKHQTFTNRSIIRWFFRLVWREFIHLIWSLSTSNLNWWNHLKLFSIVLSRHLSIWLKRCAYCKTNIYIYINIHIVYVNIDLYESTWNLIYMDILYIYYVKIRIYTYDHMLHQAPHSFTKRNSRNPLVYASGMPKPAFLSLQEWSLSTKKKTQKIGKWKNGVLDR